MQSAHVYRCYTGRANWGEVVQLYDALLALAGSPVVAVNRALAFAERLELDLSGQVATFSTGMRQKLALAAVLAADTPLLMLDEPTANLDPTVRSDVVTIVREAQRAGRTVIFSSHVLEEVEDASLRSGLHPAQREAGARAADG